MAATDGRGGVGAVQMDGLLVYGGEKYLCYLTDKLMSLTRVSTDSKEQTIYFELEDMLGVHMDPANHTCFTIDRISTFDIFAGGPDSFGLIDQLQFRVVAASEETARNECRDWIGALMAVLKGQPYERGTTVVPRRYKVILNPAAGRGDGHEIVQALRPLMARANIVFEVTVTLLPGHAGDIARVFSPFIAEAQPPFPALSYDALVVVGGDGTVHETINGLLNRADWPVATSVPLVIVPTGLTNSLATQQGIVDLPSATRALIKGTKRRLDLMSVRYGKTRVFLANELSWGAINDFASDGFLGARYASLVQMFYSAPLLPATLQYHAVANGTATRAAFERACALKSTATESDPSATAYSFAELDDESEVDPGSRVQLGPPSLYSFEDADRWTLGPSRYFGVIVANGATIVNGGLLPCPNASNSDGVLDLCAVVGASSAAIGRALWGMSATGGLADNAPKEEILQARVDALRLRFHHGVVKFTTFARPSERVIALPAGDCDVLIEVVPAVMMTLV